MVNYIIGYYTYKTENAHNNKNSKRHPVIFYTNINDKEQKMIK